MFNKKLIFIGLSSIFLSLSYLNADDLDLSEKERQKILEDREKAKKAKLTVMKTLKNEKYITDYKYNFLMNCLNNITSTNDIKDCNDSLKIELKKEDDRLKEEEKQQEEQEKKLEKMKEDREKAEAKRLKEIEKTEAKRLKEMMNQKN